MEIFQQLGAAIEEAWRGQNYDETVFPDLAADFLRRAELPNKISGWDIATWALNETRLPDQRDLHANFGDPPITLYNSSRFYIDVYFWLEGTTAIHQHAFCGAFQVLMGSSIHSHYEFETKERVNFHVATGEMKLRTVNVLKIGDVQQIHGGSQYIHSLFHLDYPSATIVVRTLKANIEPPQFAYHKPTLAIDPFFDEPTTIKKQQTLSLLLRTNHPDADAHIEHLLAASDFHTSFLLLSFVNNSLKGNQMAQTFQAAQTQARFERFMDVARRKHGKLAENLPAVFAEQERQTQILSRRTYVAEPELRFFLALLLNVEGRERILSLVEERAPRKDAIETILDWTFDLANTRILNSSLPNALGIADFGDDYLFVLEGLLRNKSVEQIQVDAVSEFPEGFAAELIPKISVHAETLRSSPIFQSLLKG